MCQNTNNQRQCVICKKQLIGRSDKRFCDIKCKNYYHGQVRKTVRTVSSETMKILTKNVIILNGIMGEKSNQLVIDKLALERLGFRFNYITEVTDKHGVLQFGVFNFSYHFARSRRVVIRLDRRRAGISPFIFERWSREIKETIRAR